MTSEVSVVIAVHETKTINGSNFYAYEYFSMLRESVNCSFVIFCEEYQKDQILGSFERYANFEQTKKSIVFLYKRTNVFLELKNKTSVVFVDIYSFKMFQYVKCQKFVYSNRFYEKEYQLLSNKTKSTSKFYGFYPDQFSTEPPTKLAIGFSFFKNAKKPTIQQNKNIYIHLLNPNITAQEREKILKNVILYTQIKDPIYYSFKSPNTNIKNLFKDFSWIIYYQNDDFIDKNNRMLLETQFFGIKTTILRENKSIIKLENELKLNSRNYQDFTLTNDNLMIKDIREYYEQNC